MACSPHLHFHPLQHAAYIHPYIDLLTCIYGLYFIYFNNSIFRLIYWLLAVCWLFAININPSQTRDDLSVFDVALCVYATPGSHQQLRVSFRFLASWAFRPYSNLMSTRRPLCVVLANTCTYFVEKSVLSGQTRLFGV